ncbi:hypothetical protein [Amycolatopsis sp.]|uniref:hypothetical protein n=1 Tax=Amycolatopsis sp. TaxID=37632 RepID=UPI002C689B28|nr:hypothetical protein [Amycolatopsis sp.]HVV11325.1 hypothetical protein [Amycolatopsis sp.]
MSRQDSSVVGGAGARARDRLSAHVEDLVGTRDALDVLMTTARAHRETLREAS